MISSDSNQSTLPQPSDRDRLIEDLLAAQFDALLAGQDAAPQPQQFGLNIAESADIDDLWLLANHLYRVLEPVEPSEEFTARLRNELVGEQAPALLLRWRKIPARYRLAAGLGGLTLTAGLALLAVGRVVGRLSATQQARPSEADAKLSLS